MTRVGTILLDDIRVIGDITVDEGEAIELGAVKKPVGTCSDARIALFRQTLVDIPLLPK